MDDYSSMQDAGGMLAAFGAGFMIFMLLLIVYSILCNWIIFTKAGKPGWAAIIPIYNIIVELEIVGKPIWWIILLLIPIVNIVVAIIVLHQLSLSFGQGVGFTLGLIFLSPIFIGIMAFSSNIQYVGPGGAPAAEASAE